MAGEIRNIKTEIEKGGILVITIDLNKSCGPSKSGKTEVIASSGGFVAIPDWKEGYSINLNVIRKK